MAAFGLHPVVHRTRIGKIVRDLKLLEATPAELVYRITVYKAKWPEMTCSGESIVKWWNEMKDMPKPSGAEAVRQAADDAIERTEAKLEEDRGHAEAAAKERAAVDDWHRSLPEQRRLRLETLAKCRFPILRRPSDSPLGRQMMKDIDDEPG